MPCFKCIIWGCISLKQATYQKARLRSTKTLTPAVTAHIIYVTLTCKFNMELILWLENLDIKGAVWCKVFHCPGSKDGLVILRRFDIGINRWVNVLKIKKINCDLKNRRTHHHQLYTAKHFNQKKILLQSSTQSKNKENKILCFFIQCVVCSDATVMKLLNNGPKMWSSFILFGADYDAFILLAS